MVTTVTMAVAMAVTVTVAITMAVAVAARMAITVGVATGPAMAAINVVESVQGMILKEEWAAAMGMFPLLWYSSVLGLA